MDSSQRTHGVAQACKPQACVPRGGHSSPDAAATEKNGGHGPPYTATPPRRAGHARRWLFDTKREVITPSYAPLLASLLVAVAITGCAPTVLKPDLAYFPKPPTAARIVHLKSFNRIHDIVPRRVTFVEAIRGLAIGPSIGTAAGVAYRNGHLYICDTNQGIVHDWNLANGLARRIGDTGLITLAKPVAAAVGDDGTVYVADTSRGEVVAYPAADEPSIHRIKPPNVKNYRPVAVAVSGERLYVADISRHRVDIFSTADGTHLGDFGDVGSEPGRLYFPMGLAIDNRGNILVSDMMNARVQVFDKAGQVISTMGQPGNRHGDMGKPRHLAIGPDGVIFIADAEFARVHLFNANGQLLMLLGEPHDAPHKGLDSLGQLPMPVGVTVAAHLPPNLEAWVPENFDAHYFLFVTNSLGQRRISLFAVGLAR